MRFGAFTGDMAAAKANHPITDDDTIVVIGEDGMIYDIVGIEYEPQSTDGEGHVTSTGATVWLRVQEH